MGMEGRGGVGGEGCTTTQLSKSIYRKTRRAAPSRLCRDFVPGLFINFKCVVGFRDVEDGREKKKEHVRKCCEGGVILPSRFTVHTSHFIHKVNVETQ